MTKLIGIALLFIVGCGPTISQTTGGMYRIKNCLEGNDPHIGIQCDRMARRACSGDYTLLNPAFAKEKGLLISCAEDEIK